MATRYMPTMAKAAAAVCLAGVAWATSHAVFPLMPERTEMGRFAEINAAIGLACGWVVLGRRAGQGYAAALGFGLTAGVALVFWGLLAHSTAIMIERSLALRYDGPVEAITAVFGMMADFGRLLLAPQVLGILLGGVFLSGLVTEWVARRTS